MNSAVLFKDRVYVGCMGGKDEGGDLGQVGQGTDQMGWDNWKKQD